VEEGHEIGMVKPGTAQKAALKALVCVCAYIYIHTHMYVFMYKKGKAIPVTGRGGL
jgi:hypothetical protein